MLFLHSAEPHMNVAHDFRQDKKMKEHHRRTKPTAASSQLKSAKLATAESGLHSCMTGSCFCTHRCQTTDQQLLSPKQKAIWRTFTYSKSCRRYGIHMVCIPHDISQISTTSSAPFPCTQLLRWRIHSQKAYVWPVLFLYAHSHRCFCRRVASQSHKNSKNVLLFLLLLLLLQLFLHSWDTSRICGITFNDIFRRTIHPSIRLTGQHNHTVIFRSFHDDIHVDLRGGLFALVD